jgi:hypothetical protein
MANIAGSIRHGDLVPQTNDRLTNGKLALARWMGKGSSRAAI